MFSAIRSILFFIGFTLVAVQVNAQTGPSIRIEPDSISVTMASNSSVMSSFVMYNDGNSDLHWSTNGLSGQLNVIATPNNGIVPPGDNQSVVLDIAVGDEHGVLDDRLDIDTNDPVFETVQFPITALILNTDIDIKVLIPPGSQSIGCLGGNLVCKVKITNEGETTVELEDIAMEIPELDLVQVYPCPDLEPGQQCKQMAVFQINPGEKAGEHEVEVTLSLRGGEDCPPIAVDFEVLACINAGLTLQSLSGDGSFDYNMAYTNQSGVSQVTDIWGIVTRDSMYSDTAFSRRSVNLAPGQSISRSSTYRIDSSILGDYEFTLYSGVFPDSIDGSDSQIYSKTAENGTILDAADNYAAGTAPESGLQNLRDFPDPFNPSTTIAFKLSEPQLVNLKIYDISGQLVRTILNGQPLAASDHSYIWDGTDDIGLQVSSGTFYYVIRAGEESRSGKMVLIR